MNKTIIGIIIAVIVIAGGAYLLSRGSAVDTALNTDGTTNTNGTNSGVNNPPSATQGQVVFSVTDAAASMGTISEITMKVNKLEAHSQGGSWITLSTTPKTYNLLELSVSNQLKLLADVKTKAGTYDQVRLTLDSVSVKTRAGATKVAKLPSQVLTLGTILVVKNGEVSSINMDFLAKESIHTTTLGDYIFAPVVKIESMSGVSLNIDANSVVTIGSGRQEVVTTVGMDIDGSIKAGFSINPKEKLSIDVTGKIKVDTASN